MTFWSSLLSQISEGNISFTIIIDGKNVATIKVINKFIIISIDNPVLAIELGIKEFIKRKANDEESGNIDMSAFENIKKAGYKIKLKYGMLEIEI